LGCTVWHSRRKEKGPAYLEDALVAGKGLGEDRTNGAAACPVAAGREGRGRRESERREGEDELEATERLSPLSGRAVNEPSSSEREDSDF